MVVIPTGKNVIIDTVDESLLRKTSISKGSNTPVTPMPTSYYTLAANQINIPKGEVIGGVEVQFTDGIFADKKTLG